ncbi:hypothetical protein [Sphingomonas sp.]|uniref:hypothetical protein n=1 Tax=Sphingomonas sp. TaxID=28214 RepID=UPI003B3A9D0F
MGPDAAHEILTHSARDGANVFYGSVEGLATGVGLLIDSVDFARFDEVDDRFRVESGLVYVLSHECDLEPANDRLLNELALVCPVLDLESFLAEASEQGVADTTLKSFLSNLSARNVSRAIYLPPIEGRLPLGGLLYLNLMSSTATQHLATRPKVCAVTAYGHRVIDMALENHFRREKSEPLPLTGATVRQSIEIRGKR